ncbi:hypothetical protein Dxin01_04330 [Deinococcus xinjiangensis]|uniref:Uncharacterized protein n=1 Tax=Deinococcus xinjiangensis TaxID=457454 RepID=A0ABP9VH61_9DEIO
MELSGTESASWKFRDGGNLGQLIDGLKSGDIKPGSVEPIRLVEKDGKLFTLDNRRLYAYQQAGKDVPYRMATPEEVAKDSFKFTTKNGGVSIRIRGMPCE